MNNVEICIGFDYLLQLLNRVDSDLRLDGAKVEWTKHEEEEEEEAGVYILPNSLYQGTGHNLVFFKIGAEFYVCFLYFVTIWKSISKFEGTELRKFGI